MLSPPHAHGNLLFIVFLGMLQMRRTTPGSSQKWRTRTSRLTLTRYAACHGGLFDAPPRPNPNPNLKPNPNLDLHLDLDLELHPHLELHPQLELHPHLELHPEQAGGGLAFVWRLNQRLGVVVLLGVLVRTAVSAVHSTLWLYALWLYAPWLYALWLYSYSPWLYSRR